MSELQPNTLKLIITQSSRKIESQSYSKWVPGSSLLVVRGEAEKYYLYRLPIWEGNVMMPWRVWGQHEGYCPDIQLGTFKDSFAIKCGTPNYAEFLTKQWYWSIDGQNLGDDLPDLMAVHFVKSANTLYAYQR